MSDATIVVGGETIRVKVGGDVGVPTPSTFGNAGKFLIAGAGGALEWASGTGADVGLREDIADDSGAALIGDREGRTTQIQLDLSRRGHDVGTSPVFAATPGVGFGAMIPNTTDTVMVGRLSTDFMIIRVLNPSPNYVIDETILRKASAGGWMTFAQRAYYRNKSRNWLTGPAVEGFLSNADWALRIGAMTNPYDYNDAPGGNWRFRGFGHGGYTNTHANNQVILTGGTDGNPAVNLNDVANMAVGTWKRGTALGISSLFKLLMPPADTVEAITLTYDQSFAPSYGYRRHVSFGRLVASVGIQDCYACGMMPMNPYGVTHFKPAGLIAGAVLSDGLGKPSAGYGLAATYPSPWLASTATVIQAYHAGDPTLFGKMTLDYGQPLRASDASIAAWAWNDYARLVQTDFDDYAKFYVYIASGVENPAARTARALQNAITYEAQTSFITVYDPAGPA